MEETKLRRSHTEVYLHCIWTTRRRAPFLVPALERRIHRCIQSQARTLGCTVLALNGMPDHVHLLVRMPPTLAPMRLVQQAKGASSHLANEVCALTETLYWQEGYSAFSVSRSHVARGSLHQGPEAAPRGRGSLGGLGVERRGGRRIGEGCERLKSLAGRRLRRRMSKDMTRTRGAASSDMSFVRENVRRVAPPSE